MMRVDAGSVRATILGLQGMKEIVAATKSVVAAGEVLREEVDGNISLTDHSLADLARMDHPYARRHGKIQAHQQKDWVVHEQGGDLRRSLFGMPLPGRDINYRVGFLTREAPHATYVIRGTRTMLPRDVIVNTANDKRVRRLMMKAIVRVLGKELKTKAMVRFEQRYTPPSATAV